MVAMSTGTVGDASPPGTAIDEPALAPPPHRKRRWLASLIVTLAVLAVAAVVIGLILAATYQPVIFGGASGGLPGQIVSRQIDTFGPFGPQTYIPPQAPAHGALIMSLGNTGPFPVTIESVSMLGPGLPAGQRQNLVLASAGPVTYSPMVGIPGRRSGSGTLAGAVLAPGQYIYVRIPVVSARCWVANSWTAVTSFWVTTKYLLWTHHVQIDWTSTEFPSDAIVAREATPAGGNTPWCAPGPRWPFMIPETMAGSSTPLFPRSRNCLWPAGGRQVSGLDVLRARRMVTLGA